MIIDIQERRNKMNNENGSKSWIRLPERALQDDDLSLADAVVLAYIIDIAGIEEKEISIAEISKATKISKSQTIRAIKNLIANKYITKTQNIAGEKNKYKQNNVLDDKIGTKKRAERDRKEMVELIDGMLKKEAEKRRKEG